MKVIVTNLTRILLAFCIQKEYLVQKIKENGGNISKTAEVIGLERSYLHRKIKSYGIEVS